MNLLKIVTACVVSSPPLLAVDGPALKTDLTRIDKNHYHLFNPTPAEYLREMSTDRPDKTESAYTIDAGHFQIETDLVGYSHNHDTAGGANTRTDSWSIAPINFKVGLCNRVDLQTVIETFNSVTFSHDIIGDLGGYAEFFSSVSTERGSEWVGTVDVGLTYGLTDNIQLDVGVNVGVTRAAEDINPFIGFSIRF